MTDNNSQQQSVLVFCRFRPFIKSEVTPTTPAKCCAAFHKSGKKLLLKYGIEKQKEYVYEAVFNMNSTQDQVYQGVGSHLTTRALGGFNASIAFMGARGTGKTYSSIGAFSNAQNNNSSFAEAKVSDGVAVRFIRDIFEKILQADETLEFTVCISVFEVLSETGIIIDLLNTDMVKQKEDTDGLECILHEESGEVDVAGLIEEYVSSDVEMCQLLSQALGNRSEQSSLFVEFTVQHRHLNEMTAKSSKISLIDLEASLVQQDPSADIDEEVENGQDLFMEIARAVMKKDTSHNFYESSLKALLYSRLFLNGDSKVLLSCSPAIAQVKSFSEPNMDFVTELQSVAIPCTVNIKPVAEELVTPATTDQVPTEDDLAAASSSTSVTPTSASTSTTAVFSEEVRRRSVESVDRGEHSHEIAALKETISKKDNELGGMKEKCLQLEKSVKTEQARLSKAQKKSAHILEQLTLLQKSAKQLQAEYRSSSISDQMKQLNEQQKEQLKQISEQLASRIARYEESVQTDISKKIAELQRTSDNVKHENEQLQKKIESSNEQKKLLEKQIAEKSTQISELKEQLIEKSAELESMRDVSSAQGNEQLTKLNNKISELESAISKHNETVRNKDLELRKLTEEADKLREVQIELERVKEKLATTTETSTAQIEKLNQRLKDSEASSHTTTADLNSMRIKLQQAEMQQEQLSSKLQDAQQNVTSSQTKINSLQSDLQSKSDTIIRLEQQVEKEKEKESSLQGEINKLYTNVSELQGEIQSKKNQINDAQDKLDRLSEELKQVKADRDTIQKKLTESNQKLGDQSELERQIKQLSTEVSSLKSQIEAKEETIVALRQQASGNDSELQQQLASQVSKIEELESQNLSLKYEVSEKLEELTSLKTEMTKAIEDKNEELSRVQTDLNNSQKENSQLKKDIRDLTDRANAFESLKSQLSSEIKSLTDKLEEKNASVMDKEAKLKKATEEKVAIERELQDLRDTLSRQSSDSSNNSSHIDTLKKQLLEKSEQVVLIESETKRLKTSTAQLTEEKSELESKIQQLNLTVESLQASVDSHKKEINTLKSQVQQLSASVQDKEQTIKSQSEEKSELETSNSNLKAEQDKLNARIEHLQKQLSSSGSPTTAMANGAPDMEEKTISVQQREIKALKDTLANHTKKVAELRKQMSKMEIQNMKQKDMLETLQQERDRMQSELDAQLQDAKAEAARELKAERQRWELESAETKNLAQTCQDELQVKEAQIDGLNQLVSHYKTRIEELELKYNTANAEHQVEVLKLQERIQELRDNSESLSSLKDEAEGYNTSEFNDEKMLELLELRERVTLLETQNAQLRDQVQAHANQEAMRRMSLTQARRQSVVMPKGGVAISNRSGTLTSSSSSAPSAESLSKCGYMKKEGVKVKSWKKRWFVINPVEDNPNMFKLSYYKTQGDKKPIKELALTKDTVVNEAPEKETSSRQFCFKVVVSSRILYMHCASAQERREWMSALKLVVSKCN